MKRKEQRAFRNGKAFFSNEKGELLWEPIVIMLLVVILVLNAMNLFQMIVKYQHVHYISKELAQTVELTGQVTGDLDRQLQELNSRLQTKATVDVQQVHYVGASKKIQFRDPFTIVVEDTYDMTILTPSFSEKPVVLQIPLKSTTEGMSEVYWKDE